MKRPSSMRNTLSALFYEAGGVCFYCKRTTKFPSMLPWSSTGLTASIDHVIPLSRGGALRGANIVLACGSCNNLKGNMMPDEWSAYMAVTPEWWTTSTIGGPQSVSEQLARRIAKEKRRAAGRRPKTVPIGHPDDPKMQTAFEHVYRNRLHMLRVDDIS